MARKPERRNIVRPKPSAPAPKPNLPQHELPEPYSRLLTIGEDEDPEAYRAVAASFAAGEIPKAVDKLTAMALDESYESYTAPTARRIDPRSATPYHALRTLMEFGAAASPAIEPLLPLFDAENDALREEMPFFYSAIGETAVAPLAALLHDARAETFTRSGAGDALEQIAEDHPELRDRVVALLEQTLAAERDDEELAAYLVCNLMDLGSRESVPLIQQAFEEERVDWAVVQMADVEEHFGLPRVTPYWQYDPCMEDDDPDADTFGEEEGLFDDAEEDGLPGAGFGEREEPSAQPYVAAAKVGRNEPCPCGSGKKYKKCHGA